MKQVFNHIEVLGRLSFFIGFSHLKICEQMGVAAVVHLYVFPAEPYKKGERCVRNVAVMDDYASLGSPLDPEEVQDSQRSTRTWLGAHNNQREKNPMKFTQSVRDVVVGSGEIVRCEHLSSSTFKSSHICLTVAVIRRLLCFRLLMT